MGHLGATRNIPNKERLAAQHGGSGPSAASNLPFTGDITTGNGCDVDGSSKSSVQRTANKQQPSNLPVVCNPRTILLAKVSGNRVQGLRKTAKVHSKTGCTEPTPLNKEEALPSAGPTNQAGKLFG